MDGIWKYEVMWNNSDIKRQILCGLICKWSLKNLEIRKAENKIASAKGWEIGGKEDFSQRVQIFNYKRNKFWKSNREHIDYN